MVGEIVVMSVCGIIGIGLISLLLYYASKEIVKMMTSPYSNAEIKVVAHIDFCDYEVYYYIDDSWYLHLEVNQIKQSWDEAKLAEPVSTLLTLIYKDFDNFKINFKFDMVGFEHKILGSISGSVEDGKSSTVRMFDGDVLLSSVEANAIRHFFYYIHNNRTILQKQAETERLQKERQSSTNMIVGKINEYLGGK